MSGNGEDLAAITAERDALRAELETRNSRRSVGWRARGVLAVVSVFLSVLLLVGAVVGLWARNSFLDTEVFTERVGGLIDEPEVRASLSAFLSEQVNELVDPEDLIREALPDQASILAAPLSGAVTNFVDDQVAAFMASDVFRELWRGAVELAHSQAVRVLSGDTPLLQEDDDRIVISLLPVINEVLAQIGESSPEIFGREVDVDIPTVTVDDAEKARAAISDALGVELDEDFGTFTIYDEGQLSAVQEAVNFFDNVVWLLVVAAPLAMAGTMLVSTRRRRTLLQLTVGIALGMVLMRRLVFLFQDELLELVQIESNKPAVEVTIDAFLNPLLAGALWIGIGALVIALLAAVAGPYRWALTLRRRVVEAGRGVAAMVSSAAERTQDEATLAWIARNKESLRVGGLLAGLVLLFVLDVGWLGFFVLVGIVGAYELAVSQFGERAGGGDPDDQTPETEDAPGAGSD